MSTKDPIAAELGRRGGIKGGKARSKSLSPERRRDIARRAAAARWGNKTAVNGTEAAKSPLPGVATATGRATLQFGDLTFEVFALADGRQLLGLLSVEAALAGIEQDGQPQARPEQGVVTFKEHGSWQVSKGLPPAEFLALCRRVCSEAASARQHAAQHAQLLGRIALMLVDCAAEGLERRLRTALQPA